MIIEKPVRSFYIEKLTFVKAENSKGEFIYIPLFLGGYKEEQKTFKWRLDLFLDMTGDRGINLEALLGQVRYGWGKIVKRIENGEIQVFLYEDGIKKELREYADWGELEWKALKSSRTANDYGLAGIAFNIDIINSKERKFCYELSGQKEFSEVFTNMRKNHSDVCITGLSPVNPETGCYQPLDDFLDDEVFKSPKTWQEKVFVIDIVENPDYNRYFYGFSRDKKNPSFVCNPDIRKAAWFKCEDEAIPVMLQLLDNFEEESRIIEIETDRISFPNVPYFL